MFHGTTVLAVHRDGKVAVGADGQVTIGSAVMKQHARKVRRIFDDKVIVGFAGATGDAFTLYERFEDKLKHLNGNLVRSAVEMAKDWRTDKYLRRLEALLIAADGERLLVLSGTGDVIEPDDGIAAIGSGGLYALAAARGILETAPDSPESVVARAMNIAAGICVYTNTEIVIESLGRP